MANEKELNEFLSAFGDSVGFEDTDPVPTASPPPQKPPVSIAPVESDDDDDYSAFMSNSAPDRGLSKPWMKFHRFNLVKTVEEVRNIVNQAIEHGRCALDLECEGLDNRIDYDAKGFPHTKHKIVGYCLSIRGVGYYIPVRHLFNAKYAEKDPNVDPVGVEAEIRRLCLAAQPVLTDEGRAEDPLFSKKIATQPRVIIYFWNAKFDQEFLFPVTGIDVWHPSSFEDGMLAAYTLYSDDLVGLKEQAERRLKIFDPENLVDGKPAAYRYQMIKFEDLFESSIHKSERRFQDLYPVDGSAEVLYGCSDAICTEILCEAKGQWEHTVPDLRYEYDNVVGPVQGQRFSFTYRLEKQAAQAVRDIERNRTKIDKARIVSLIEKAETEKAHYEGLIKTLAEQKGFQDFNPGSTGQLGEFLFGESGLNITPKPDGNAASQQYKTDAATLEAMAEGENAPQVLNWIVKYRQIDKIIGTCLKSMAENCDELDQLRFNFKQTGAATGRFTAPAGMPEHGFSGIPIQGIPGKVDPKKPEAAQSLRSAFVAREGYTFVKIDYASQELRIVANLSQEPVWVNEFLTAMKEGREADLHTLTAKAFFGQHITRENKLERGMGKCVHPDTLVFSGHGGGTYRTLNSLGEFSSTPDTFSPVAGVLVYNGQKAVAVKSLYNGGVKPLVHVVTTGGLLTCTNEHRFKLRDGGLVRAADLKTGDLLEPVEQPAALSDPYPICHVSLWEGIPSSTYSLSHDWAYLAGAYAGDGTGSENSAALTHGKAEKVDAYGNPYSKWIASLEESCRKCELQPTPKGKDSLYLGSRVLVRLFQNLGMHGKRSKSFRIPWWVLAAGKKAFLHYLGGLIDTDGTVSTQHHISFCTKDYVFAGQIAAMARACGLDFNVGTSYNKTYKRYYIELDFTVASSWELKPYLRHAGKIGRLRAPTQSGQTRDRFEVRTVISGEEGQCVDLELDTEDHLYVANGILTHNTANFALIYGGGPQAIQRATKCDKVEAARRKQNFDKSVPVFAGWVKGQHNLVKKNLGVMTAFKRFIAIPDAAIKPGDRDHNGVEIQLEDVKKIRAACERKSTNFPIQGSGADILKISLVQLLKELHKRGWRRNGGDDSVRMVMTVHDEIVFEVRHDRLMEAMPVLLEAMESPSRMVGWKIPLVADPSIGLTWDAKYDWHAIMKGEKPVPDWLVGILNPGHEPPQGSAPAAPPSATVPVATQATTAQAGPARTPGTMMVATVAVNLLTKRTADRVVQLIAGSLDTDRKTYLCLVDRRGNVLLDPSRKKISVIPEKFRDQLVDANLTNGELVIKERPL